MVIYTDPASFPLDFSLQLKSFCSWVSQSLINSKAPTTVCRSYDLRVTSFSSKASSTVVVHDPSQIAYTTQVV